MMRILSTLCFFFILSTQLTFGQTYLLDSTASLSFFGATSSSIFLQKYNYDEQYRISQIVSDFQIQNYEYFNEYDHSIVNGPADGSTFYSKINNYYTSEGLIITSEQESYNLQNQEFTLANRLKYEYDQDDNLIEESRYTYSLNGQETLANTIGYSYTGGNLIHKIEKYYSGANNLYLTRITDWLYQDGLLVLETQESLAGPNNQNSYIKTYEYNNDNDLESYVMTYFNQMDSSYQYVGSYEYTEHGVEEVQEYTSLVGNPFTQTQISYRSFVESLFYDQDTFTSRFIFDEQEFNSESRFNTEHYSTSGDSVLVRRESRQADFEFESFLTIVKELHIIHPESQTMVMEEEAIAAHIFPSPAKANATLIIQKQIDSVDHVEIYNMLGQKIEKIDISNQEQAVITAPHQAGNYYLVYYSGNHRIGKVGKLVVQ
ncbi:T9SS type A sorting domain-containing protein [Saprospiraceae bacterium]|nr:T9SS type A sorting domain-containing protein [Saprospiraceae bacterium]